MSINKVIIVGNLGRVCRGSLDGEAQAAFDSYLEALGRFSSALSLMACDAFSEAARQLSHAMSELRRLAAPFAVPKKIAAPSSLNFKRTAAFFHAAKVDSRNLP